MISNGGEWKIINKENPRHGDLQIDESSGAVILILYNFTEKIESRLTKEQLTLICGHLNSGADVSLLNCSILSRSEDLSTKRSTYVLQAEYAFFGIATNEIGKLKFNRIEFQIKNAILWGGLSDFNNEINNENAFNCFWRIKEDVSLDINSEFSIIFYPKITSSKFNEVEEIKLSQSLMCDITSKNYYDISIYEQQIKKVLSLVTFCTEKSTTAINIKHFIKSNDLDFEADLIISKNKISSLVEKRRIKDDYILLADLIVNEKRPLKNWFLMYEKLESIIDLFCLSIYYPEMPIELHFINIMYALESFHNSFVCSNLKDYLCRVDMILEGCPKQVYDDNYALLTKGLKPKSEAVNLSQRIADLFLANFNINFYCPIKYASRQSFIQRLVDTRNYYTHYDYRKKTKVFSFEEMRYIVPFLRTVLIYHVANELETDQLKVKQITQSRLRQLSTSYEIDHI